MGLATSNTCHDNFAAIQSTYQELGNPLAAEKLEGSSHSPTFLGIELDRVHMEAKTP